ncbi:hypothetical protein OAD67_03010, partial [bacterium]|nr:hypothetical protein [bacterium]
KVRRCSVSEASGRPVLIGLCDMLTPPRGREKCDEHIRKLRFDSACISENELLDGAIYRKNILESREFKPSSGD